MLQTIEFIRLLVPERHHDRICFESYDDLQANGFPDSKLEQSIRKARIARLPPLWNKPYAHSDEYLQKNKQGVRGHPV